MGRRFIGSPGVQVTEIDASLRRSDITGTSIYLIGFSHKGPVYEVTAVSSITEFEEIFGKPTSAAERYFYHNVRYVLQTSNANLTVCRLPYTVNPEDDKYSVLVYPVIPIKYEDPIVIDEWVDCEDSE